MLTAAFTATGEDEADYFLGNTASVEIGNLAMEVAGATQSWDALHMLPFADMKIRNLTVLRNAGRSIVGHA